MCSILLYSILNTLVNILLHGGYEIMGYIERKVVIVLLADHEVSVFTLILCIEHISKHITTRWL